MSVIRFRKGVNPVSTPTGTSKLWVDEIDNHLKRTLDNGDVIDYDQSNTIESIQDAVGSALTDTDTIDLTYDDGLNQIRADIKNESINSSHIYLITPVKIGDELYSRYKATINTTNNSLATAFILDASSEGTLLIEAKINSYRTGGTGGSPGDGASFIRTFRVKTVGSTVTIHDVQSDYTSRDNPAMNIEFMINATDINFRVKGINNNNLRWTLNITVNRNN